MIAVMMRNGYVTGVLPDYTEEVNILDDFILVDELPTEIADTPPNTLVKYVDGVFSFEEIPTPEPVLTPEQVEIAALKVRIEDLNSQLEVTNATVDFLLGI